MGAREAAIARDLLTWFDANKREMPWRKTKDPYAIWISEIMLQQTQVATVIPYYERFMAQFPTPEALATAPTDQVLKAWEGLGYYSRARNLQAAAREVTASYGGAMPTSYEAVRGLPGIGDYTAGAIMSIAYGQAVPAVDGNVLRVMSRLELIRDDVTKPATKKRVEGVVRGIQPGDRPGHFNEALMELGATTCTPRSPRCAQCPVELHCKARQAGVQESLPVKAKKQAAKAATLATALVARHGRWLLVQRPEDGLWAGLWAFPTAEVPEGESAEPFLGMGLSALGIEVALGPQVHTVSHSLTHRQLTIPVFSAQWVQGEVQSQKAAWVSPTELTAYALPVPFQKVAAALDPGPLFRLPGEA